MTRYRLFLGSATIVKLDVDANSYIWWYHLHDMNGLLRFHSQVQLQFMGWYSMWRQGEPFATLSSFPRFDRPHGCRSLSAFTAGIKWVRLSTSIGKEAKNEMSKQSQLRLLAIIWWRHVRSTQGESLLWCFLYQGSEQRKYLQPNRRTNLAQ